MYVQLPATKIDIEMSIKKLSNLARMVAVWSVHNHLTFNHNKTKAIIFGTARIIKIFKDLQTPEWNENSNNLLMYFPLITHKMGKLRKSSYVLNTYKGIKDKEMYK